MKIKIGVLCFAALFFIQVKAQVKSDSITLNTETGNIEGTLLLPPVADQVPVALIIAGSGPTDRDGNNPMMKNNSLKMLAEGLTDGGVATLRYDKRGIAASRSAGGEEEDMRFEDYINDAKDWVQLLKKDPRFSDIVIIGHSEGSLIGMIAAREKEVSKFISLSGAGLPAGDLIRQQISNQAPILTKQTTAIVDELEAGKTVDSIPPMLYSVFRPSIQPYMISWFRYDPCVEIGKLDIPILIMQGSTDLQVDVSQAEKLAAANPRAELKIIEGMNHILKEAPADPQKNMQTYSDPELPLKEGVVNKLLEFIKK